MLFYAISVMPIGLLVYSFKSDMHWNVFKYGGFHKFQQCMLEAVELK